MLVLYSTASAPGFGEAGMLGPADPDQRQSLGDARLGQPGGRDVREPAPTHDEQRHRRVVAHGFGDDGVAGRARLRFRASGERFGCARDDRHVRALGEFDHALRRHHRGDARLLPSGVVRGD
jgi:hypothetical protein